MSYSNIKIFVALVRNLATRCSLYNTPTTKQKQRHNATTHLRADNTTNNSPADVIAVMAETEDNPLVPDCVNTPVSQSRIRRSSMHCQAWRKQQPHLLVSSSLEWKLPQRVCGNDRLKTSTSIHQQRLRRVRSVLIILRHLIFLCRSRYER